MPASGKMLKKKEQKANRAQGIGDEQGRLPSRVKPQEVKACCTQCFIEIRMTKTNTEARVHAQSKHPGVAFATCFPGQYDPTAETTTQPIADQERQTAANTETVSAKKSTKKKKEDLSFLDNVQTNIGGAKSKSKK
mmetsp:Transcript_8857/g.13271  ORF Transcript_8857/g.13271 Transcript_8857/m.13271 type:complete len:136 (+) Transcript_8857:92-499(+)|eukprot:CAMPEP_0185023220 /NCGR_PEP_ID=MMETSP1103-20130426/5905_1 /TAXON_ID=36769 /ORGANISM="Paraphysomonas bandaiensis, Strain Caron Lab Isolate" /LENGTH=135 /DNA_ID=CAMNT_0027555699 /DNA_START=85 /DNA_END=492 /DNA_ORIENTATION=+